MGTRVKLLGTQQHMLVQFSFSFAIFQVSNARNFNPGSRNPGSILRHGQSSFVFLGHDFSIRLSEDWGYCVFKKGGAYKDGDEVWVKKCGVDEESDVKGGVHHGTGLFSSNNLKSGKFKWSYNMQS